ncbi:NAD(P)/FAD-dependent oxidoreductase [Pseudomonas sp. 17104299]|uniref:NAD(P)/FAD-dependent oxidoreductase n=1 Tax=Pseudomonas sp. 17104299 TaxID=2952239 RepID=UPI002157A16D|nr:FAD-dependent oxidoreductase [Pseudomonas sp. 17104299]
MKQRVVIVGGGAGGAELAATLGRRSQHLNLEVSLVDCATRHFWKPRLHEVAAGLRGDSEAIPYLALARVNNFHFRLGPLVTLDAKLKTISLGRVATARGNTLLGERVLQYDTLVLAFGSQVNDFGTPGVREHCLLLDDSERAFAFQKQLLEAAVLTSQGVTDRLRIGIVGAGATGVELAAELSHSISVMRSSCSFMPPDKLDITLIDMAPRPLANSSPAMSDFATHALQRLGVTLQLNTGVSQVLPDGFLLKDGNTVPCDLKVWASGVIGHPFAADLNLKLDHSRRIICNSFLRCVGEEDIYAMGDCASVLDPVTNRPLPTTAQVAHQQAGYLLKVLSLKPGATHLKAFQYRDRGSLVSLGTESTTGEIPLRKQQALAFKGIFAKFGYLLLQTIHRATLLGWRRTLVLVLSDALRRTATPPVKLH